MRLADGGLETSLIFHQGLDLPHFAAFPLVESDDGRSALRMYWEPYLALARERRAGFVIDTVTWRANPDWASRLGYDTESLRAANDAAARFARELAARYHTAQIAALAEAGVDQVTALTLTYAQEAIGFVRAATAVGVPSVVSFTVETDGSLPSGQSLREAVELVDDQTDHAPAGFMINCAHPTHFEHALVDGAWLGRISGVRANASRMSHAELDAAEGLDDGDPTNLAEQYRRLLPLLPGVQVLGGCCGTDHRHVRAISQACLPA